MVLQNFFPNIRLRVLFNDQVTVGSSWNFQNVISAFNRLYLITEGSANVVIRDKIYTLEPGDLFFTPKFTIHNCSCKNSMTHYYICFTDESWGGGNVFNTSLLLKKLKANHFDEELVKRFFELSPHNPLPDINPKKYDNKKDLLKRNTIRSFIDYRNELERNGILQQLYSKFITKDSLLVPEKLCSLEKIGPAVFYIDKHLDSPITVAYLADLSNLTVGHFSKIFKDVLGIPPIEYLQEKRVQRAQTLLQTSHLSISEIAVQVGVPNLTQFSRMFSRFLQCSPSQYRKLVY